MDDGDARRVRDLNGRQPLGGDEDGLEDWRSRMLVRGGELRELLLLVHAVVRPEDGDVVDRSTRKVDETAENGVQLNLGSFRDRRAVRSRRLVAKEREVESGGLLDGQRTWSRRRLPGAATHLDEALESLADARGALETSVVEVRERAEPELVREDLEGADTADALFGFRPSGRLLLDLVSHPVKRRGCVRGRA